MSSRIQQLNNTAADLVARVSKSVVHIGNGSSGGAGTVWHPDGLIVTNAHVAQGESLWATLSDGRSLRAQVLAHDRRRDIAALSVDATGLPAIELGDSRSLQAGQWVFALGHPFGVRDALTGGVAIGTGSNWNQGPLAGMEWLMLGLHLRPGNSGGPVFDTEGRMVGISTALDGPESGLAVPIHLAKRFLQDSLRLTTAA